MVYTLIALADRTQIWTTPFTALIAACSHNYRLSDTNTQMIQLRNQIHGDNQVLTGMIIELKERVSKLESPR